MHKSSQIWLVSPQEAELIYIYIYKKAYIAKAERRMEKEKCQLCIFKCVKWKEVETYQPNQSGDEGGGNKKAEGEEPMYLNYQVCFPFQLSVLARSLSLA